ncbi:FecCD family ABC transporter permease [Dongshaea marina]|uniref:FecCD family ABC transporter permease n=1 Tax=Dongshaea marina TaxID=2047966 RepID=UPI000D3E4430|nr:iron ABC transporter permease [Dongshaea marina]
MKDFSYPRLMLLLCSGTLFVMLVAACLGRYPIAPLTVLHTLWERLMGEPSSSVAMTVLDEVRLPRIAMSLLVGANLSVSGACYQSLFRNPLVSPFILGISAGAGFGAALAILFTAGGYWLYLCAFGFAVLAVGFSVLLGGRQGQHSTLVLVLSGIVIGSVFTALLALLKYTADPDNKLPVIEYWLMGSLGNARPKVLAYYALFTLPALALLWRYRWRLNLLANPDEIAQSLGVHVRRERMLFIGIATLLASASVAVCGIIGWLGLVVPHLARMLVGADHRKLLPVTLVLGGAFLLVVDTIARCSASYEIPLGIITALVGAPVFALLLRKGEQVWI